MRYLLFLFVLLITWSCCTYNRCYQKYGKRLGDSTTHTVTAKAEVKLAADSTAGLVTPQELADLEDGKSLQIIDTDLQADPDATLTEQSTPRKPKITITRKGKDFEVKAVVPADTVRIKVKVPCKCPPPVVFEEPVQGWVWLLTGAAFAFAISLFVYYARGKA
jgi:hypothetical protein